MVTLVSESEYISFDRSAKMGNFSDSGSIIPGGGGEKLNVAWFNTDAVYGNGSLFTVKVRISENTPSGTYPISLLCTSGDTLDGELRELSPTLISGSITVMPSVKENPFADVNDGAVYYDAILWAYYHTPQQITGGFTATEFRPQNPCTRAQVVTFLWRAKGCPEPTTADNPFSDVSAKQSNGKDNPYYEAILWAAEQGITTGYSGGLFKPNDTVTRAQFVTFLWRADGKPATGGSINGFADAGQIASPYQQTVAWAVERGITTGYEDNTFRPNAACTRWAVVLFMYRDIA